jgi:hypothetical protein
MPTKAVRHNAYEDRWSDRAGLDVETIAHNKGRLISVSYEQRRRDGDSRRRKREIYGNGNSAVILPYDADQQTVLLTKQLRIPEFCRTAASDRGGVRWKTRW